MPVPYMNDSVISKRLMVTVIEENENKRKAEALIISGNKYQKTIDASTFTSSNQDKADRPIYSPIKASGAAFSFIQFQFSNRVAVSINDGHGLTI